MWEILASISDKVHHFPKRISCLIFFNNALSGFKVDRTTVNYNLLKVLFCVLSIDLIVIMRGELVVLFWKGYKNAFS